LKVVNFEKTEGKAK